MERGAVHVKDINIIAWLTEIHKECMHVLSVTIWKIHKACGNLTNARCFRRFGCIRWKCEDWRFVWKHEVILFDEMTRCWRFDKTQGMAIWLKCKMQRHETDPVPFRNETAVGHLCIGQNTVQVNGTASGLQLIKNEFATLARYWWRKDTDEPLHVYKELRLRFRFLKKM